MYAKIKKKLGGGGGFGGLGPSQCRKKKSVNPGLEVIKLEFILRLKIKHNDWLLPDTCPHHPIIALYFITLRPVSG